MGLLHTSFESGAMFTAGSDYGNVGTSGLNEITNRINVESGILGLVSGTVHTHTHNGTDGAVLGRPSIYSQPGTFSFGEPAGGSYVIASGVITTLGNGSLFVSSYGSISYSYGTEPSYSLKLTVNDVDVNTPTTQTTNEYTHRDVSFTVHTQWLGSIAAGEHTVKTYFTRDAQIASGTISTVTLTAFELV